MKLYSYSTYNIIILTFSNISGMQPGEQKVRGDGRIVRCTGANRWETLSVFGKRELSDDDFADSVMVEDYAIPQKRSILRRRKYTMV